MLKYLPLLILLGCAQIKKPPIGTYTRTLTVQVAEHCSPAVAYYIPDPKEVFICISTSSSVDWPTLWRHETGHLFLDLTGLPQPAGHEIQGVHP